MLGGLFCLGLAAIARAGGQQRPQAVPRGAPPCWPRRPTIRPWRARRTTCRHGRRLSTPSASGEVDAASRRRRTACGKRTASRPSRPWPLALAGSRVNPPRRQPDPTRRQRASDATGRPAAGRSARAVADIFSPQIARPPTSRRRSSSTAMAWSRCTPTSWTCAAPRAAQPARRDEHPRFARRSAGRSRPISRASPSRRCSRRCIKLANLTDKTGGLDPLHLHQGRAPGRGGVHQEGEDPDQGVQAELRPRRRDPGRDPARS